MGPFSISLYRKEPPGTVCVKECISKRSLGTRNTPCLETAWSVGLGYQFRIGLMVSDYRCKVQSATQNPKNSLAYTKYTRIMFS